MTIEYLLTAGIAALSGTVGILWASVTRSYKKLEARADDCEKDRLNLWIRVSALSSNECKDSKCPNFRKSKT